MTKLIFSLAILFSTSQAMAHGQSEERFSIEPEIQGPLTAGKISFPFKIFDAKAARTVGDTDLDETHTKKLHMIVYDQALQEFNHTHPTFDGTTWNSTLELPKNGTYFIWAQGQLNDGTEFSTFTKAQTQGGIPENPTKPLGDVRKSAHDGTVVELAKNQVKAGKMTMLNFVVSRQDGLTPEISPYLGAFAHVIAVSPDGDELIHVHPMEGSRPNSGMLHATFPTHGDYRIWIQLIDRGTLKTIPLSVTVIK